VAESVLLASGSQSLGIASRATVPSFILPLLSLSPLLQIDQDVHQVGAGLEDLGVCGIDTLRFSIISVISLALSTLELSSAGVDMAEGASVRETDGDDARMIGRNVDVAVLRKQIVDARDRCERHLTIRAATAILIDRRHQEVARFV
jgi:hypothetical protein